MEFLIELSSYYAEGFPAIVEKVMIWGMVLWLAWCVKLYLAPADDIEPIKAESAEDQEG